MISNDTVEVSVTYGTKITFFLRMISIGEEQKLRQRAFGLKEEEKAEKEYWTNVEILKELSVKLPFGLFPDRPDATDEGDERVYSNSYKTAAEAIDRFFEEKTVLTERIAHFAVRGYFVRLQPAETFI
jgi:hypothetical protein